jgi:hypothetical protein
MKQDIIAVDAVAYEILDECQYGGEEFFVLISSIDYTNPVELQKFKKTLLTLSQDEFLAVYRGHQKMISFGEVVLDEYLEVRIRAGEDLAEPPAICDELSFVTTDAGIAILDRADRP